MGAFVLGLLLAGQIATDLPAAAQVPAAERLWTATLASTSKSADGEFARVLTRCRSASTRAWKECTATYFDSTRRRIATLHAAPNASSAIVGTVFEELAFASSDQLQYRWTVERATAPGERLAWPAAAAAFDHGLRVSGVQRRGNWIRLLSSIPVDGWIAVPPDTDNGPRSIDISARPVTGEIVEMGGESYKVLRVTDGTVEYRREIPSDGCVVTGQEPPTPPTLRMPLAALFAPDGQTRFAVKHARGC